jgi:hypothetical protein
MDAREFQGWLCENYGFHDLMSLNAVRGWYCRKCWDCWDNPDKARKQLCPASKVVIQARIQEETMLPERAIEL